jgi:hypothetical protein
VGGSGCLYGGGTRCSCRFVSVVEVGFVLSLTVPCCSGVSPFKHTGLVIQNPSEMARICLAYKAFSQKTEDDIWLVSRSFLCSMVKRYNQQGACKALSTQRCLMSHKKPTHEVSEVALRLWTLTDKFNEAVGLPN